MSRPLRILYLTPFWPTERSFGSELRTAEIIIALQSVGQVDCIVLKNEDDEAVGMRTRPASPGERLIKLRRVSSRSLWDRVRSVVDPRFTTYFGHLAGARDRLSILDDLPKYDLVWIHQMRTANVLAQWQWPRSVLDLDDIPSSVLQSEWKNGKDFAQRLRAARQMGVAKGRERLLDERFNVLSVCSEADRQYLGSRENVHVIPNGFVRPREEPARAASDPPRIGFIGTFDYAPNVKSMHWFAAKCWPRIKQQVPAARLRLIGRGSDGPSRPAGPEIDALGWMADPAAEQATWSAMVVPVQTGGGTRIKIAEGFSRKCPIVSTSLGAYGYEAVNGREMFLADTPEDFANACVHAIRQPAEAAIMADRAWQLFLKKYTWDSIRPSVWAAAEDCIRRSGTGMVKT